MWTQIEMDLHFLSKRFHQYFSRRKKHKIFFCDSALRDNTLKFSVYTVTIFLKCTYVCATQTTYKLFTIYIEKMIILLN